MNALDSIVKKEPGSYEAMKRDALDKVVKKEPGNYGQAMRVFKLENEEVFVDICALPVEDENGIKTLWFMADDIPKYLELKRPKQAFEEIHDEWKMNLEELFGRNAFLEEIPDEWSLNTMFLTEPGLYSLVCQSKSPRAITLMNWLCEEMLPLARTDQYFSLRRENGALTRRLNWMIQAAVATYSRFQNALKDLIAKPQRQQLLHTLVVNKINPPSDDKTIKCSLIFTRCQKRSLGHLLNLLNTKYPEATEVYRKEYVPNGINVLNCLKEALKSTGSRYRARRNILDLIDYDNPEEIVGMVKNITRDNTEG